MRENERTCTAVERRMRPDVAGAFGYYTIGLDYGSLSCRGVLVRAADGEIIAEEEYGYPHAIMYDTLPDGTKLPPLWALQDPQDYIDALEILIPRLLEKSGVPPERVLALGIDTTASTVVAVDRDLVPLCKKREYAGRIHAWPKMWKHHAAFREAAEITEAAKRMGLPVLERYGGAVGAEFLPPKLLQTLREDREVFDAAETFFECGDWMVSLLIGGEARSGTYLTCKSMWDPEDGYPKGGLFDALTKKLAFHSGAVPVVAWPGESAGTLLPEMAKRLGLTTGTVVSAGQLDGYAGLPGSGVYGAGTLAVMLGTSNSYMLLDRERKPVPGICASVENSVLPGFTNYAAGQASAGDILTWFAENCVPGACQRAAEEQGVGIHDYLTALAARKAPGESGLIALDWWNGNKSVLHNSRLSGMLLGMDLSTRPEDIYRALIEATAYGARKIVETFENGGIAIDEVIASGGMAMKNPLLMQIYADVLGKSITVSACRQSAALGSAMYAAAAAGGMAGGYDSVSDAVRNMAHKSRVQYTPDQKAHQVYNRLYGEYLALHDYFGSGGGGVMERLRDMRN